MYKIVVVYLKRGVKNYFTFKWECCARGCCIHASSVNMYFICSCYVQHLIHATTVDAYLILSKQENICLVKAKKTLCILTNKQKTAHFETTLSYGNYASKLTLLTLTAHFV